MSTNKFIFLFDFIKNIIFCEKAKRSVYAENFYFISFKNKNF